MRRGQKALMLGRGVFRAWHDGLDHGRAAGCVDGFCINDIGSCRFLLNFMLRLEGLLDRTMNVEGARGTLCVH